MIVVMCEDKGEELKKYTALLYRCAEKRGIKLEVHGFESGNAMLFEMENEFANVDLIYLDIHMPGIDGIQTGQRLRKSGYTGDLIFFTVDPKLVFQAFDLDAMNYMLKGETDDERFEAEFVRAYDRAEKRHQDYISFNCSGEGRSVAITDILYFEVEKRIITVYYLNGNTKDQFSFYSSLEKIENILAGRGFVRNYRSQLVSLRYVRQVTATSLTLRNGEELPVGRAQKKVLRDAFQDSIT